MIDPRKVSTTVPIFADAVRGNDLVRCNYLVIETDLPSPEWQLSGPGWRFPFLLNTLNGVILQPIGATRFNSLALIDELFEVVEKHLGLTVEVNDVWLHRWLFSEEVLPGTVYRIRLEIFREIYAMREGRSSADSWESFAKHLLELDGGAQISKSETSAFAEWSNEQVSRALEMHRRNLG